MMLPPRMIMTNPMFVTVSSTQTADSASSLVLPARCTLGSSFLFQQSILLLSDLHVCHQLLLLLLVFFFLHEGNKSPHQESTSLCAIINHLFYFLSLFPSLFLTSRLSSSPLCKIHPLFLSLFQIVTNKSITQKSLTKVFHPCITLHTWRFLSVLWKSHWAKF